LLTYRKFLLNNEKKKERKKEKKEEDEDTQIDREMNGWIDR